ncbi:MAG TPA: lysylphosphatidylglycerol synthase transmembrane domain-containing protein [bacterium]|nr:lysylphosphatidylglycerol synthase transmembrane domain-containing protein [bacterium]
MRKPLLLIASLTILLILARAAGFQQIALVWKTLAPQMIALSVACYFASIAARVLSWRVLLADVAPPGWKLLPPLALGFVLGHVAPAKTGEPATAVLVSKSFGIPLHRTLSALTAERALQLVLLLATFLAAAVAKAGDLLEIRGAVQLAAALLVLLLVGFAAARPLLARLAPHAQKLPRVGPAASDYFLSLHEVLGNRRRLILLAALAGIFWILQYLSLWAILRGGGTSIDLPAAADVAGAAILGGTLSLIPLGTQDGISAVVLRAFGVPLATGFSLALFHTALSLACGGVLVLLIPLMARKATRLNHTS